LTVFTEYRRNIGLITAVVLLLFLVHVLMKRSGVKAKGLGL
jgi:hypothetical protein